MTVASIFRMSVSCRLCGITVGYRFERRLCMLCRGGCVLPAQASCLFKSSFDLVICELFPPASISTRCTPFLQVVRLVTHVWLCRAATVVTHVYVHAMPQKEAFPDPLQLTCRLTFVCFETQWDAANGAVCLSAELCHAVTEVLHVQVVL
jgi:hypothetical protein